MTKLVLTFCLLLAYGNSIAQMPYAYELEKPRKSLGVYLLEDNPQFKHYLRFFDFEFESVVYFHNSDTLCELTSYSYHNSKQFLRKDFLLDVKRVYRQDSLQFAVEVNDELYSLVLMEDQVFHIRKVFELLELPQNKGVFYQNKLMAFLQLRPVLKPMQVDQVTDPWFVDPQSKASLVSEPCRQNNNLPCLYAALQFGATDDYTTAQQIANYLIKRFNYGYGDTSQYNPVGLLTSDQNKAVCAGYSQMYEWLLKESNVAGKYVSGSVRNELNDMFYTGHSHAWNEIDINGKRYYSDITWANDTSSHWLMNDEANFFLTHFAEPTGDTLWDRPTQHTMYEFMHQPMVRSPEKTAAEYLKNIHNTLPFQCAEKEFILSFTKPVNITHIHFYDLIYPFVSFEGEKAIADKLRLSTGNSIPYKKTTNEVRFQLNEKFTRVAITIEGIGTIDYCIFKGTEKEFYQFMLEQIDARSPYSVAMAFLACAKLNDAKEFNKLKPYLANPKMSFKTFQKQAKMQHVDDFSFAIFNATRHYGDFSGYSFEYANDPSEPRIYLGISDNEKYFSFTGFATESWNLGKK